MSTNKSAAIFMTPRRRFSNDVDQRYQREVKKLLDGYDALESILPDDKNALLPRVSLSIQSSEMRNSITRTAWEWQVNLVAFAFVTDCVLAPPLSFSYSYFTHTALKPNEWLPPLLFACVGSLLLFIICAANAFGPQWVMLRVEPTDANATVYSLPVVYGTVTLVLAEILSSHVAAGLRDGLTALYVVAFLSTITWLMYDLSDWLLLSLESRWLYKHPDEAILRSLFSSLRQLEQVKDNWNNNDIDIRLEIVQRIDQTAALIERYLLRRLCSSDASTNTWLKTKLRKIAAGFRLLNRDLILPQPGDRERLIQALSYSVQAVAKRDWMSLTQEDPPPIDVRLRSLQVLRTLRVAVAVLLPLGIAAVLATTHLVGGLDETTKNSIITICLGWTIVGVVGWLNPGAVDRLSPELRSNPFKQLE